MVRFPSVLYPFSILLIFSSSDRLLLYRTCHRCASPMPESMLYLLNPNCKRCWLALYLSLSISLSKFNIEWSRQVLRNTRHQAVYSIWQLLVRFIARLHRKLIFTHVQTVFFCQKFVALAYQRFDKILSKLLYHEMYVEKKKKTWGNLVQSDCMIKEQSSRDTWSSMFRTRCNRLLWQRKKQNS